MTTTRMINDAVTDYAVTNGEIDGDGTETSTVLWLLTTQRGSCPIWPEAGNRMATIDKLDGEVTERAVKLACEEALAPLVAQKRISDVVVNATVSGSSLSVAVEFVDVGTSAQKKVATRLGGR